MNLRFWQNTDGQHRASGDANTAAHQHRFAPRHCAGTSCAHDHPGEVLASTMTAVAS